MALAKRKLLNFTKKHGDAPVDMSNPRWLLPERFVARRKSPFGPGWEILVKWTGACSQQTLRLISLHVDTIWTFGSKPKTHVNVLRCKHRTGAHFLYEHILTVLITNTFSTQQVLTVLLTRGRVQTWGTSAARGRATWTA